MSRPIGAAAIFGIMAASIIILWPSFFQVEPEAATSVTRAEAAAAIRASAISPFDIMTTHGKNLPAEVWDAF
jgi:hypothetical protein